MNENENEVIEEPVETMETDYVQAIKDLKANSVSRDDYMKLKQENKNLLQSLVNGTPASAEAEVLPKADINELRKELFFNKNLTNLEYAEKFLELRDRIIEEEGVEATFMKTPDSSQLQQAIDSSERVCDVLQQCIDSANGDDAIFTAALQSRINDIRVPNKKF